MKKKFISISIVFLILFFSFYTVLPHVLAKYHNVKSFKNLGLEVKKLKYGNECFEYVEGGKGPLLIMVHGFESSKSYWIPYMKRLAKTHTIVAMDLPGHGNSSSPKEQKYDIQALSKSLENFIEMKNLKDFHIVGASMGGGIISIYAYEHPEKLKTLTLINPLGIDHGIKSELQLILEKGRNVFFPKTLEEFDELAIYVTGKPISLNLYFKKYALSQMIKRYIFFKQVFKELISSTPLDEILPKIETPSLILMGQKDRIIHPDSFEYFVELMPNINAKRIQNGSHAFVDQNFEEAINSMEEFLNRS